MDSGKISVIVPVYNVYGYLSRCLESIVNQSYRNIELIVVDDQSSDGSYELAHLILEEYVDIPCRVLQTPCNSGVGFARNLGLQNASSEYISFVDSDDWLDSNYFDEMIIAIESSKSEIAVSGMLTEYNNVASAKSRYQYERKFKISGNYALRLLSHSSSNDCYITPIVNNKLYKASYLSQHNLVFPVGTHYEDDVFTFQCLARAKNVVLVPETKYHYFQRQSSLTHMFSKEVIDDLIKACVNLQDILRVQGFWDLYRTDFSAFFEKCISSTLARMFSSEQRAEIQKQYLAYFFSMLFAHFPLEQCISYLDAERIKDFFRL